MQPQLRSAAGDTCTRTRLQRQHSPVPSTFQPYGEHSEIGTQLPHLKWPSVKTAENSPGPSSGESDLDVSIDASLKVPEVQSPYL